ncbi:tape measure protein [Bacillus phage 055SW001]|nr:tape measure protein [Bacillus phage 055SW001]
MAGIVSEVRAKFTATASGVRDTLKQMRTDMQSFGRSAGEGVRDANNSVRLFDTSIRGLQQQMRALGRAGQMNELTSALRTAQNEARTFGIVTTESANRVDRAIAEAKNSISKMGGIGAQQMANLQNHIKTAEQAMAGMGRTTTQTYTGASKMANQATKATANFRKTFLSFTAAAVGLTAVTTGMGALIAVTDNYQQALNHVQNSTGATEEETRQMGQAMQNVYAANYGQDWMDVAESMAQVRKATGDVGKSLENTTKYALGLRDTFGFEVQESAATASTMMKQFGISSKEAYTLMAQGAQQGLDKNGDMMDSFNEYSVYFKQLGFDAEGMWNVFKAGSDAGAFNMDKVGDAVKELGIRVKDGSKSTSEGFKTLGLDADTMAQKFAKGGDSAQNALTTVFRKLGEIEDPVKRNAAGVALFGTQFEDLEYKTIVAMGKVRSEADMSANTLDKMNQVKYNSLGAALQGIGRQLLVSVINPMQQKVMPVVNDMVQKFITHMPQIKSAVEGAFNTIGDVFNALKPTFENVFGTLKNVAPAILVPLGAAFKGLAAVIPPILNHVTGLVRSFTGLSGFAPILGGLITAFVTYQTTLKIVTAAQKAWAILVRSQIILTNAWRAAVLLLNTAWLANPIGLVIAAIAGLAAAFAIAYNKSETFRNIVNQVWNALKTGFNAAINWITTTLPSWWNNIVLFFQNIWNWIKGFFAKWGVEILAVIAPFIGVPLLIAQHWNTIKAFFSGLWAAISGFVMGFVNNVVTWFTNLGSKISSTTSSLWSTITGMWNSLVGFFTSIGATIASVATALWANVKTIFTNAVNNIKFLIQPLISWFKNTWENIKLAVLGVVSVLISTLTGDFEGLKLGLLAIWTAIKRQLQNTWDTLKELAIRAFTLLKTGVTKTVTQLKTALTTAWNFIKTAVINAVNNIKSRAIQIWEALKSGVIKTMSALKTGVVAAWNFVKTAVINAVNNIKSRAVQIWNALKTAVINSTNALKSGAVNAWNGLKSAVTRTVSAIKSFVVNGFNGAKTAAINAFNALKSGVSNAINAVVKFVSGLKTKIVSTIKGINLRTIGSNIIQGLLKGITGGAKAVLNKAQEIADGIKKKIKGALGIHSPSREMIALMGYTTQGMEIGLDDGESDVTKKAGSLASGIIGAVRKATNSNTLKALGKSAAEGLNKGLDSMVRTVRNTAANMATAVTDGLDMTGAVSGGLDAGATVTTTTTFKHVLDLVNVPANIDQATLTQMLMQALDNPRVQTKLDRTQDVIYKRQVRPQGGK